MVANIAEGKGRFGPREFGRFLDIALGSLRELHSLVILSNRLGLLDNESARELDQATSDTIGQLVKLIRAVRRRANG